MSQKISTEHSPLKIVWTTHTKPQNITSTQSSNVIIIAAENPDFLNGACPGAAGEMSKKGWSNSQISIITSQQIMQHL